MQTEFKLVIDFWVFCVNNFRNDKYPQIQGNLDNSNFLWGNCTKSYRENAWVDVSHPSKDGDIFLVFELW